MSDVYQRIAEFERWIRELGLRPRGVSDDGKWRRCPTDEKPRRKNGAHKLLPGATLGWAQDWTTMAEPVQWRPEAEVPEVDMAAARERWAEQMREQERTEREGAARAEAFWRRCPRLAGSHPYLEAKGLDVTGAVELRTSPKGWLVAPSRDSRGRFRTLQAIRDDGTKRFFPDAPMAGSALRIARRRSTVTVMVEGLATGLAIYRAVPDAAVMVCWSTGNLVRVAREWKVSGLAVVAGDNDHGTEARGRGNPGIIAATKAAEELGCGVAIPEGITGTDWCDLVQERVAEGVRGITDPYTTPEDVHRTVLASVRRSIMREARFLPT